MGKTLPETRSLGSNCCVTLRQLPALSGPQFLFWYSEVLGWILLKVFDCAQSPNSRDPVKNGTLGSDRPGFESRLPCSVTLSRWLPVSEPQFSHLGMSNPPFSNGDYVSISLWRPVGGTPGT